MRHSKIFVCYKCTRTGQIFASSGEGCYRIAHAIGWRKDQQREGFICSHCPGGSAKGNLNLAQAEAMEKMFERAYQDPAFKAQLADSGEKAPEVPAGEPQDALPTTV